MKERKSSKFFSLLKILIFVTIYDLKPTHAYQQTLDVYFEALCPDSKRLLVNQVPTIITEFGKIVNGSYESNQIKINLVPFGKANVNLI
jgi:hypothetical protein